MPKNFLIWIEFMHQQTEETHEGAALPNQQEYAAQALGYASAVVKLRESALMYDAESPKAT
jgi:hypothetical protein